MMFWPGRAEPQCQQPAHLLPRDKLATEYWGAWADWVTHQPCCFSWSVAALPEQWQLDQMWVKRGSCIRWADRQ
jgi:hypothetical protein